MTAIDYIILGAIALSALLSLRKGFTIEALSLASWVAAFVIAKLFSLPLSTLLIDVVSPPSAQQPAAFVILFVLTLVVAALIKVLIKQVVSAVGLSGPDRLLGMVFGAARGIVITIFCISILSSLTEASQDPWWNESLVIPHLLLVEEWTNEMGRLSWEKIMSLSGSGS